jgi:hypothetical protein
VGISPVGLQHNGLRIMDALCIIITLCSFNMVLSEVVKKAPL